jgi:glycosyltransferase involved in cell wall biosynthesis
MKDPDIPLVSVITIVLNGEKSLEKTNKSVLNQTYKNIEYIIIDGGSTDGTLDVVKKYDKKITYWISEPDNGIGDAFNKGIAASTGELIGIINADDWYNDSAVETIVGEYLKNRECIFHARMQYWNPDITPYYIFSGNDRALLKRGTINHPTVFVPKKIYDEIGLFRTDFKNAVDYEWLVRAKLHGIRFHYIDQVIANMCLKGTSDKNWLNNYREIYRARKLHGINTFVNAFSFLKSTIITLIRLVLESLGLHKIVSFYRRHWSISKKETSPSK